MSRNNKYSLLKKEQNRWEKGKNIDQSKNSELIIKFCVISSKVRSIWLKHEVKHVDCA